MQFPQEYICLVEESFQKPLYVYLVDNRKVIFDITKLHKFVGYCPLIFALPSYLCDLGKSETIQIVFSPIKQNGFIRKKDAIASLLLRKIIQKGIDESLVCFYEGIMGRHRFIPGLYQAAVYINNRLYGKQPGNVFLKGNLYCQVQIAYAVPRKICLITVGQNELYNQFPTDLHGQIGNQYYVISLRHEGKACQQVEATQRIILSEMEAGSYKKVYALGKNHMQSLKARTTFDFSLDNSKKFQLPLPREAVAYKELELVGSCIKGIHKLMLFKIVYSEQIQPQPSTLVHIHNCFATWRKRQGMAGNYLLR
jgi:hypothetical protein